MRSAKFAAVLFIFSCISANAGEPEAQACGSQLDANAKLIFDDTLASVEPGVDLKSVVTAHTKALVMVGKLPRSEAKPAAKAAGDCLKLVLG